MFIYSNQSINPPHPLVSRQGPVCSGKRYLMMIPKLILALLPCISMATGQANTPSAEQPTTSSENIRLDVTVDAKNGQPVTNLHQEDFTVLDNKSQRPITSFKLVSSRQQSVEVILLIDAVNSSPQLVSFVRGQTDAFLKANGGALAHPTTLAVLTDKRLQIISGLSTSGNALDQIFAKYQIPLRDITPDSQRSDSDRLSICLTALHQLAAYGATLPGRKLVLVISPGWPLLSGPGVQLTARQRDQVFADVVFLSSRLRQGNITLYNINPIGASQPIFSANYYQNFVNGVAKADDAQFADVGIQVLSLQTGGLTLESQSNVTGMIEKCLADADSWYQISFTPLPADKPNEYHHIEIRLNQHGLIARTRTGYYSNPVALSAQ